jgi:alkanesulfonate monooxygenase SsuD/methylene tetrahydromethanopterin reductase-like flavin-dependent oxidoreductase (luciferase family)
VTRLAANLDQLSGGRFVLGVGTGWSEQEYAAVGVPFRERGRILDEYLAAITAAWTAEVVSFDGTYARYEHVATGPRTRVPIWVGGAGPSSIRRAARFADAWHPINAQVDWVRNTGLYPPSLPASAPGWYPTTSTRTPARWESGASGRCWPT